MKTLNIISLTGQHSSWLVAIGFLALLLLSSCGGSSSDDPVFTPVNTLVGKVFVLGSQYDNDNDKLIMYVTGTDPNGNPLTLAQLQAASVTVGNTSYPSSGPELSVTDVVEGDKILSLSLVTDWSNSTNGELGLVAGIYSQMLDNLPLVYDAQVMTFSDALEIQLPWTEAFIGTGLADIKAAVSLPHSVRNMTALYDSMGAALEADPGDLTDGLIDQCRPAHMLVVFTDGNDNKSFVYSASALAALANADKTVVIMLGTSDAIPGVLTTLAGDYGAVVQVSDIAGLVGEVHNWSASLKSMHKLTLSGVYVPGDTVSITINSQTAVVDPNLHCTPIP